MRHALILANHPGDELRPLTSDETPTAFLRLGDRRTLLQRSIDRLSEIIPPQDTWVLVSPRMRARVASELDPEVHVLAMDEQARLADLTTALSFIADDDPVHPSLLVQPACQIVTDEANYRQRLLAGLAAAEEGQTSVSFTARSGTGDAVVTGIQAWSIPAFADWLTQHGEEYLSTARWTSDWRDASGKTEELADLGWIRVEDWAAVQTVLAYVEKPWGYERLWALNEHYAGKILFIKGGESLSLQYHEVKDETIRIVSGRMRFRAGGSAEALETFVLEPGMSFAIATGLVHQMEAIEDCTVVEVSTPHLTDVVRIVDRYGRT